MTARNGDSEQQRTAVNFVCVHENEGGLSVAQAKGMKSSPLSSPRLWLFALSLLGGCATLPDASGSEATDPVQVEITRPLEINELARFPEQDANLMRVDVSEQKLVFEYRSAPSQIPEAGQVLAGALDGGYVRKVVNVTRVSPTRYELVTEAADLGDIILDGAFSLTFAPQDNATSFIQTDTEVQASAQALEKSRSFNVFDRDLSEFGCDYTSGGRVDIEPSIDFRVETRAMFDYKKKGGLAGLVRGELRGAQVEAKLIVNSTLGVHSRGIAVNQMCNRDLVQLAREQGSPVRELDWSSSVMLGPIPLSFTQRISPRAAVSMVSDTPDVESQVSWTGTVSLEVGARYDSDGWSPIWTPARAGTTTFTSVTPGASVFESVVSVDAGFQLSLLGMGGPEVHTAADISGTLRAAEDCSWTGGVSVGARGRASASIDVPLIDASFSGLAFTRELPRAAASTERGSVCGSGGMTPVMPSVGAADGNEDPCTPLSNDCGACAARSGCGFCAGPSEDGTVSGTCMQVSKMGECAANPENTWAPNLLACTTTCRHLTDCGSCMADWYCGWCPSTGTCVNAESGAGQACGAELRTYGEVCE